MRRRRERRVVSNKGIQYLAQGSAGDKVEVHLSNATEYKTFGRACIFQTHYISERVNLRCKVFYDVFHHMLPTLESIVPRHSRLD